MELVKYSKKHNIKFNCLIYIFFLVIKVTVTIADVADSEYVKTKSNLLIKTDAKLGDVKNNKFDAVVIPGGPSYKTLASVSFLFYFFFL